MTQNTISKLYCYRDCHCVQILWQDILSHMYLYEVIPWMIELYEASLSQHGIHRLNTYCCWDIKCCSISRLNSRSSSVYTLSSLDLLVRQRFTLKWLAHENNFTARILFKNLCSTLFRDYKLKRWSLSFFCWTVQGHGYHVFPAKLATFLRLRARCICLAYIVFYVQKTSQNKSWRKQFSK